MQPQTLRAVATVTEVLPATGLAYLTDTLGQHWTITKGTAGSGLEALQPGVHVELTVTQHDDFSYVSEYGALA
jgi:hypothetical protein